MQYELRRRRLHLEPNSDRLHLVGGEIHLQHSITSDWRVVSQDSINDDDLRKGCVSLFEQIDSGLELSSSEVNYAIRFLEYTTMSFQDGRRSSFDFFNATHVGCRPPEVISSSLLKIISYPSETLRAATLAFFSTLFSGWSSRLTLDVAHTDFFPNLISFLKPHEIPFGDATMDFHRHVTNILINFIDKLLFFSPQELISESIPTILQAFCPYLRHLVAHPAFFPWKHLWMTFDSILQQFEEIINDMVYFSSHPELVHFVDEMKNTLSEELASLIGLADQQGTAKCLLFGRLDSVSTSVWVKGFEWYPRLRFADDGTYTIRENDELVSSSKLDVRSLMALLTPTQPQHATLILTATHVVSKWINTFDRIKHFWNGWLSHFLKAVDPSHLPFTPQYHSLHALLVEVMRNIIYSFEKCEPDSEFSQPTITQSELEKYCLTFLTLSKEYLVHLSHNAYALHPQSQPTIYDLPSEVMRFDLKTPTTEAFRRELKEEMISSALASSSPPFILTAELVCALSDCETMDVVDRIVGLLDRDCSLDDSTILRMCVFIDGHNTRSLQLAFRNTGRTKEEYLHAFESFLSLHIESFKHAPIRSLLSSRRDNHEPTLEEWDEADLETVPIVVRMRKQNKLSIDTDSENFDALFVNFVLGSLQQARRCATRLTRTQLERLIAPSIDCLNESYQLHRLSFSIYHDKWTKVFRGIFSVCDQPVVAHAFNKTGFFCRVVNNITLCVELPWSIGPLSKMMDDMKRKRFDSETGRMLIRGGLSTIGGEGLEDAIEFVQFMKTIESSDKKIKNQARDIHLFFGVNLPALPSDDMPGTNWLYHFLCRL
ncbi:hypothetical protein BLNAU_8048 [Blattamonas nauphoetae]|uniref:Uncharacterized protein n=1 Tax=Blattamonas nauphoetae TaxID=2049346 RepID=A0ABQ9XZN4_9EUKA|nr:hypothetical protein BLNAU_8048 [Blattamonas nauphoetae]